MRTKTLLLTAALSAAGLLPSTAQVLSVNQVGYVNATVPGGNKLAILAVPLNGNPNNLLNTNIRLPDPGSDGCLIFRWDENLQTFKDPVQWYDGFGWYSASDENPTVSPGEAFWFQNPTANPVSFTMVGEVPSGTLNNPVLGGNRLGLKSSIVPKGLPLGDTTLNAANTLNFPGAEGDLVFVWDSALQTFKEPYQYYGGFGWFSANPDDPGAAGPTIVPGTGFWAQKTGANATWTQTYSVSN